MSAGLRELHIAFNVANRRAGGTGPACDGPDCQVCADLLKAAGDAAPRVAASELVAFAHELRLDASGEQGRMPAGRMHQLADLLSAMAAPPATSGSTHEKEQEKNAGLLGSTAGDNS